MKIEPVTRVQLDALIRAVGHLPAMIGGLYDVDLSRGRGVMEGQSRCLWTKDQRRVNVVPIPTGGIIVSCSKEPDPGCP